MKHKLQELKNPNNAILLKNIVNKQYINILINFKNLNYLLVNKAILDNIKKVNNLDYITMNQVLLNLISTKNQFNADK